VQSSEEEVAIEPLIAWLVIVAVAGFVASRIVTWGHGFGTVGNIIVGILGSFVGGALFPRLGLHTSSDLAGQIITAAVGSVILLLLFGAAVVTLLLLIGLVHRTAALSRL
jgi:uncharacterized membrane protein YeaQ/YmgE (transglycosylase-associated protein family)